MQRIIELREQIEKVWQHEKELPSTEILGPMTLRHRLTELLVERVTAEQIAELTTPLTHEQWVERYLGTTFSECAYDRRIAALAPKEED